MIPLALSLSTLSLLVLAAHFLRRGQVLPCVAALAVLGMLFLVRRIWAVRLAQGVLALAVVLWSVTTVELVRARRAAGGPAARLGIILGAVVLANASSAWLLGTRRVAERWRNARENAPGS